MKPSALPRWAKLLGAGLGAAGVLSAVADLAWNEDDVATPQRGDLVRGANAAAARPAAARTGASAQGRVELERLTVAPPAEIVVGNAFDAVSWYEPPPPPPMVPPPAAAPLAPSAPPLPFAYLGSYVDAAAPVLILAKGDRVYTVSPGDVIDGVYRVESMVGSRLELTYLPLNVRQMLGLGGA